MPKPKKTWVRKEKIVSVGNCKYCNQEMTNQDSFVPIGKVIRGKNTKVKRCKGEKVQKCKGVNM